MTTSPSGKPRIMQWAFMEHAVLIVLAQPRVGINQHHSLPERVHPSLGSRRDLEALPFIGDEDRVVDGMY